MREYLIYKKKSISSKIMGIFNKDTRCYIIFPKVLDTLTTDKRKANVFSEQEADQFIRENDYSWKLEKVVNF